VYDSNFINYQIHRKVCVNGFGKVDQKLFSAPVFAEKSAKDGDNNIGTFLFLASVSSVWQTRDLIMNLSCFLFISKAFTWGLPRSQSENVTRTCNL
jgi:hypothetical protein